MFRTQILRALGAAAAIIIAGCNSKIGEPGTGHAGATKNILTTQGVLDPAADFQARCSAPGVLRCIGWDNPSDFVPASGGGGYATGLYPAEDGTYQGFQDTTTSTSGSSLKFNIRPGSQHPHGTNPAGYYLVQFGPDGTEHSFGEGSDLYFQFRYRLDPALLNYDWTQAGGEGWKIFIVWGPIPGESCTSDQFVQENTYQRNIATGYTSCSQPELSNFNYSPQLLEQGDYNCPYAGSSGSYAGNPNCFNYVANTWITETWHVHVGTWGSPNSTFEAWVAPEGQPLKKFINLTDFMFGDGSNHNVGLQGIQFTPYFSGADGSTTTPGTAMWFDEFIVSTQPIAAPGTSTALSSPAPMPSPASSPTPAPTMTPSPTATPAPTLSPTPTPRTTAPVKFIQVNATLPYSAQTIQVKFKASQIAGDLNVVVVGWNDSSARLTSISDSLGDKYSLAIGPTIQTGEASQAIYFAKNILAGTNTVTVKFSSAATYPDVRILEYSGLSGTVDTASASVGIGNLSETSLNTTNSNDLIIGANLVQTHTNGSGSGFTDRVITYPDGDITEDALVKASGNYLVSAPVSGGDWLMQAVAFKAVGNVTATPTPAPTASSTPNATATPTQTPKSSPSGSPLPIGLGWLQLSNTMLSSVAPNPNPGGSVSGVLSAWGGGLADTKRNQLIIWGGGHVDYFGNEVYALDVGTQTMKRITNQSPINTNCPETYSDGTPSSRHTYNGLQYLANLDKYFMAGAGLPTCGDFTNAVWSFNPSNLAWVNMNPPMGPNPAQNGSIPLEAYDPVSGMIYEVETNTGVFWKYDPNSNSWTNLANVSACTADNLSATIDPGGRYYYCIGSGGFWKVSLEAPYGSTQLTGIGCSALINSNGPGFDFDGKQKLLVGWAGGGTVYSYNPATDSCSATTFSGGPGSQQANGTFGRFRYFPGLNVFALVNDAQQDSFLLKVTNP